MAAKKQAAKARSRRGGGQPLCSARRRGRRAARERPRRRRERQEGLRPADQRQAGDEGRSTTRSCTRTSSRRPSRCATPARPCARAPRRRSASGGLRQAAARRHHRRRRGASPLSEGLRNKVLDTLFGAEEEFDYTSTTSPAPSAPARRCPRARSHASAVRACAEGAPGAPSLVCSPARSRLAGQLGLAPWRPRPQQQRAIEGEKAAADRRGDALERRPARRGGLDVRPRRARGAACRAGCCTTTSAPRSGCWPRSCAATASCAWPLLDDQLAPARRRRRRHRCARRLAEALRRGGARVHHASSSSSSRCRGATRRSPASSPSCCAARASTWPSCWRASRPRARCTCAPSPRRWPTCSSRWPTASACACSPRPTTTSRRRSTPACSPCARCSTERPCVASAAWISVPCSSPSRTPTAPTPTRPASR